MLSKILQTFVFRFSSAIFSFVIVLITAHLLGTEGRGELSLLLVSITFILMLNNFIGGPSLVYLVPRYPSIQLLKISYAWGFIVCILGTIMLKTFSLIPDWLLFPVFLLSVLQSIVTIHHFFLLGKKEIKVVNIIAFTQPFMQILLILLIYWHQMLNVIQVIYAMYFSYTITVLFSIYTMRNYFFVDVAFVDVALEVKKEKSLWKDMISYGFMNQVANIAQLISYRANYYFLSAIVGIEALGIFSTGTSVAESVWLIGTSISLVQYSDIANTNDKMYAKVTTLSLLKLSCLATIIALIVVNILPSEFYVFIFGNQFSEIKVVLLWLSPGILAISMGIVISHFFSGTGRYYINAVSSGIGMLFSIISAYYFINHYQIMGASMVTSISYVISTILLFYFFIKKEKVALKEFIPKISDVRMLIEQFRTKTTNN